MLFGFLVREERVICTRDVGLAYPGIEEYSKGWTVRPLKGYTSWVQIEPKMEDKNHQDSFKYRYTRRAISFAL